MANTKLYQGKQVIFDMMIYTDDLESYLIKCFWLNCIKWDYDINKKLAVDYNNIGLYQVVKSKEIYKNRYIVYLDNVTKVD